MTEPTISAAAPPTLPQGMSGKDFASVMSGKTPLPNAISPAPPAQQAPSATPAIAPPPTQPTPSSPATSDDKAFNDSLSKTFDGRFKTAAEIKELLVKHDELSAQYATLKEQSEKSPFTNDFVKELNTFMANNGDPDTFFRATRLNVGTMSPLDKVVHEAVLKNPTIQPDKLEALMRAKYMQGDDFNKNDTAVMNATTQLEMDALSAEKFLTDYISKSKIPDGTQRLQEMQQAWQPIIPTLGNAFEKLSITNAKGDILLDFSPPKESIAAVLQEVGQSLPFANIQPTKEGIAEAHDMMRAAIITHELPNILQKMKDNMELDFIKRQNNPRMLNKSEPAPGTPSSDFYTSLAKTMKGN